MVTQSELDGFEVFVPSSKLSAVEIRLSVTKTVARLSKASLAHIGYPKYVNVFFDYTKKRMMVTAGDKDTPNSMKLSTQANFANTLCMLTFLAELEKVSGEKPNYYVSGKKAESQQPAIIYDLAKVHK